MAESKGRNLTDKADPTVSSGSVETGYPDGTHPVRPISEQTYGAPNKEYAEMPDSEKPDPSTVAQYEIRPDEK